MKFIAAATLLALTLGGCSDREAAAPPPPAVHVSSIQPVQVHESGLQGRLYLPTQPGRHPALLLIGGSEGGSRVLGPVGAAFAEQGYVAFVIAYWRLDGLPPTLEQIPLEYFRTGLDWLEARPQTDPARVGVIGWSRGSEAALVTATRRPDVKAVVAVSPANFLWGGFIPGQTLGSPQPAWTEVGHPLPYIGPAVARMRVRNPGAAAIPVERITAPIMLLSGGADRIWPSAAMAAQIQNRLQASGRPPAQLLHYPRAGHAVFIGDPDGELAVQSRDFLKAAGGTAHDSQAAWRDNWPKVLTFLDKALAITPE